MCKMSEDKCHYFSSNRHTLLHIPTCTDTDGCICHYKYIPTLRDNTEHYKILDVQTAPPVETRTLYMVIVRSHAESPCNHKIGIKLALRLQRLTIVSASNHNDGNGHLIIPLL